VYVNDDGTQHTQGCLQLLLLDVELQQKLLVATTHLKAKEGAANEAMRVSQVRAGSHCTQQDTSCTAKHVQPTGCLLPRRHGLCTVSTHHNSNRSSPDWRVVDCRKSTFGISFCSRSKDDVTLL
jgi:hypothetical protein